jgi:hypothetical protein
MNESNRARPGRKGSGDGGVKNNLYARALSKPQRSARLGAGVKVEYLIERVSDYKGSLTMGGDR